MLRRVVGGFGRVLIALGILILLFVVYQLWGTNLSEASSQDALRAQFGPVHTPEPSSSSTTTTEAAPAVAGDALGVIRIPRIGLDKYLVEGTSEDDLKKGPGHYPGTPLPGEAGDVAIAGHRTTYGAPFYNLDQLANGDQILITTKQGSFRYDVFKSLVVAPDDVSVVAPTADNELTLTTCNPRFSASQRLVVKAHLVGTPVAAPAAAGQAPTTLPGEDGSAAPRTLTTGSAAAIPDTIMWGLAGMAFALLVWAVARRWRRLPSYLLGVLPMLVLLYFFYENVSQLLPSSI